jgi:hypothetical protein
MADDVQQEAPSPDGQADQGRTPPEQSATSTTKADEEPHDEDVPSESLDLDAKKVQHITQIWKIEHQHVGVQQTGAVHGGRPTESERPLSPLNARALITMVIYAAKFGPAILKEFVSFMCLPTELTSGRGEFLRSTG